MNIPNVTQRIVGGDESQVVVGAGAYTITGGKRAYALTVRTQGTIIAWMIATDEGGLPTACPATFVAIALNQGDYFVLPRAVTQIQLTAATDSVTLHCDRPFIP